MANISTNKETLSSLEGDGVAPQYDGLSIDEAMVRELRNTTPRNNGKFNTAIVSVIIGCLEKGISLNTAAMAAGIAPMTALKWYNQGKADFESLSDEQIEGCEDMNELLTDKGKFFLMVNKARSHCIVEIHDMLYDRCFENNKEWLGTYILEREEPEKYNLKHRMTAEVDASTNTKATVEFKFVDGFEERPDEDKEYIGQNLEALKKQYGEKKDESK